MALALYHVGQRGYPGFEVKLTNPAGVTFGTVLPATVMVGTDGNSVAAGSASDPTNTQAAPLAAGTDRSGTTNATAGTSQQLAAANPTRRSLNIQNISTGNIGINEFGGAAAIGTAGTYTVAAGGTVKVGTNRQINVVGSAASQPYTATEA